MTNDISKRRFLSRFVFLFTAAPLLPLVAMASKFLARPATIQVERKVVVGSVEAVRPGITVLKEHGIALVRDDEGIVALSLSCTHLGCSVSRRGSEFVCPCHGSRFRADGALLKGPATAPLPSHELRILEDGRILANLGEKVTSVKKVRP